MQNANIKSKINYQRKNMNTFKDKENNLTWFWANKGQLSEADIKTNKAFRNEIDTWQTPNISKYILGYDYDFLSDLFYSLLFFSHQHVYYGFQGEDLVVTSVVDATGKIATHRKLREYAEFCKQQKIILPEYLSLNETLEIVNSDRPLASVDYLVVNPKFQRKGIGSRAVQSIKNNLEELTQRNDQIALETLIHAENFASQAIFKKAGLKPIQSQSELKSNRDYFCML